MTNKYKILCLDGGGIRGVLSARILKQVETTLKDKKRQALHEYFDLISGTSTGSILAAGIACQMEAEELIKVYQERGKDIFLKWVRWQRGWRWISRFMGGNVLYPHECGKDKGLANVLKEKLKYKGKSPENWEISEMPKISEIPKPHLLILAYDVFSRNTTWFSNNSPNGKREWYDDIELWKICTASASAPTFFPPYKLPYPDNAEKNLPHIDGGVSANNPSLSAIAHALWIEREKRPLNLSDIAVLSIGTGKTTQPFTYEEVKQWGLPRWAQHIPDIFMDPGAKNTEDICRQLLNSVNSVNGVNSAHLRLNFDLNKRDKGKLQQKQEIKEEIDDPTICSDLIEAAEGYLKSGEVEYMGQEGVKVKDAIDKFIEFN